MIRSNSEVDGSVGWRLDRRRLRRASRQLGPPWSLPVLVWKQLQAERRARHGGSDFRQRDNAAACRAYQTMADDDFVQVNARQAWANWRTIPDNLDGLLPSRPVRVLDLCCGVGDASQVLAWCCPPDSTVMGFDIAPQLIELARQRSYQDSLGNEARVVFRVQGVLEPWCEVDGRPIPDSSVDLVNANGAIACHFDEQASAQVIRECTRVLRPGGLANLDAGPAGTSPATLRHLAQQNGFRLRRTTRSCFIDRNRQLCLERLKNPG